MSNVCFTPGTNRYLNSLRIKEESSKASSLSYMIKMMVNNIKNLYDISNGNLIDGTSFTLNMYGFPDMTVEYLAHFGHGNLNADTICAEIERILHGIKSDTVFASILTECEYKTLILPKGFQIRLNDLDHNALTNTDSKYYTLIKEYTLNLDSVTLYMSINEDNTITLWPRVFCTYYEVDTRTDKLAPKYLRSIKIDSIMNYHLPSNLDLEYTTY